MVVWSSKWNPKSGDVVPVYTQNSLGKQLIVPMKRPQGTEAGVPLDPPRNSAEGSLRGEDQIELLHSSSAGDGTIERMFHSPTNEARERRDNYKIASPPWMADNMRTSHFPRSIPERDCKIHGAYNLPKGYQFAHVPSDAVVRYNVAIGRQCCHTAITSSYSFTKSAITIGQAVYASVTLYQARGDQITVYGYAAFGLTVIPYILMTILNLLAGVLTPEYPALYMVHSKEMDEAIRHGGCFDGVVGTLDYDGDESQDPVTKTEILNYRVETADGHHFRLHQLPTDGYTENDRQGGTGNSSLVPERNSSTSETQLLISNCFRFRKRALPTKLGSSWEPYSDPGPRVRHSKLLLFGVPIIFGGISLLMVGLMSGFHSGLKSTDVERGFVLTWLVVGMVFGIVATPMSRKVFDIALEVDLFWSASDIIEIAREVVLFVLFFGVFMVPALGGFVVVGQMILNYGSCTRIM